jgi:sec-independent protein translocase protein TatB
MGIGLSEMIIIGVIALIFIGPEQLPDVARILGRTFNELKNATEDLTRSLHSTVDDIRRETEDLRRLDLEKPTDNPAQSLSSAEDSEREKRERPPS